MDQYERISDPKKHISTNYIMEAIIWGLVFGRQPFSKKAQYLVNGESDQKSVTSKKDAELNSRPRPPH